MFGKLKLLLAQVSAAVVLGGCGGVCGGGTRRSTPGTTVKGTAATGDPVILGAVTMICANGTATTAVTGTDGSYSITATGTAPCLIKVKTTVAGTAVTLHPIFQSGQS